MIGQKGILFSLMILLLLSTLLSLHQTELSQENKLKGTTIEANAFRKTSDKFANIKNNIMVLTTSEKEKEVDQRILPFDYGVDGNTFSLGTELPVRQSKIDSYTEILNAFRLFLENTEYSKEFDSLQVDINTLTPESWGGTDKNISFLLEPQCTKYSILDENIITFDSGCEDYNYLSIRRQDILIDLTNLHDFNALSCSFNGLAVCFNDDFNALNNQPYLSVIIDDSACGECDLSQTSIRGHFDPLQTSSINISCSGASCANPDLVMNFEEETRIDFGGQRIDINATIEFDSQITNFNFNDANILVENNYFGTKRWN